MNVKWMQVPRTTSVSGGTRRSGELRKSRWDSDDFGKWLMDFTTVLYPVWLDVWPVQRSQGVPGPHFEAKFSCVKMSNATMQTDLMMVLALGYITYRCMVEKVVGKTSKSVCPYPTSQEGCCTGTEYTTVWLDLNHYGTYVLHCSQSEAMDTVLTVHLSCYYCFSSEFFEPTKRNRGLKEPV